MANWASIRQLTAPSHETYVQGSRFKVRSMLIRLVPNGGFSVRQRRAAPGVVKRVIGRRLRHRSDAEQAPEGVEREEPPVEAERKLFQVRLKVLRRDAVVNAIQPGLQVAEDEVDERQMLLRDVG